jgi:hypothetical protein
MAKRNLRSRIVSRRIVGNIVHGGRCVRRTDCRHHDPQDIVDGGWAYHPYHLEVECVMWCRCGRRQFC